ncbi:hypothetical protein CSA57_03200 [candidate division KSB3 bacterium]|nr:MAG: hypothetical protein CSA57_03200 [candidate division KSB3 bacterium]
MRRKDFSSTRHAFERESASVTQPDSRSRRNRIRKRQYFAITEQRQFSLYVAELPLSEHLERLKKYSCVYFFVEFYQDSRYMS